MENIRFITQEIVTSKRISNDEFSCGGYEAVNVGTATAYVDRYPIAPGEGITRMQGLGSVRIKSDVEIQITPGAKVVLTQAIYI